MDWLEHNRRAWDRESAAGSEWCTPVGPEVIREARAGRWSVALTANRAVPRGWFGELKGKEVLCLASGGGQQAPVLAAAGARVVSLDLSAEQLAKDRQVAEREGLSLRCLRGNMAELPEFPGESFDLIFHPIANLFVPDVRAVWRECARVLRPGGVLLAGFMNPGYFLFDHEEAHASGTLTVKYALPYAEPGSLDGEARRRWEEEGHAAQFSHSLEDQIGGQLAAGLVVTGCYEDTWSAEATLLDRFTPVSLATRSVRPVPERGDQLA
jgi:SAM-dependent methyltransferase